MESIDHLFAEKKADAESITFDNLIEEVADTPAMAKI